VRSKPHALYKKALAGDGFGYDIESVFASLAYPRAYIVAVMASSLPAAPEFMSTNRIKVSYLVSPLRKNIPN
jgi:hypothetical protein